MAREVGDVLRGGDVENRNDAGVAACRKELSAGRELDASDGLNESWGGLEH
jgi:hypothetical protein